MAGYFGRYDPTSAQADIAFAAALYARDGGLLGAGRPELWPTFGANVMGTCCFPGAGLGMIHAGTGEFVINLVSEDLAETMVRTSAELPHGESEIAAFGLAKKESRVDRHAEVDEDPQDRQDHETSTPFGAPAVVCRAVLLARIDSASG